MGAIRRAARARCETACLRSGGHSPTVAPPGRLDGRLEDGVVAEAARRPAGAVPIRPSNVPRVDRDGEPAAGAGPVGQGQGEHAAIAGAAALGRQARQRREQLRVVVRVGRLLAGVAPGPDARPAAEGVDLQAGIVGQRGEPGASGVEARLERRVGREASRPVSSTSSAIPTSSRSTSSARARWSRSRSSASLWRDRVATRSRRRAGGADRGGADPGARAGDVGRGPGVTA